MPGERPISWWRRSTRRRPYDEAGTPTADDRLPSDVRFQASIGGGLGPSYEVVLYDDGRVRYCAAGRYEPMTCIDIAPHLAVIDEFWEDLARCGLWGWAPRYENWNVLDGTTWQVRARHGAEVFESVGINAYPDTDDPSPSPSFDAFTFAVSLLAEGREFE